MRRSDVSQQDWNEEMTLAASRGPISPLNLVGTTWKSSLPTPWRFETAAGTRPNRISSFVSSRFWNTLSSAAILGCLLVPKLFAAEPLHVEATFSHGAQSPTTVPVPPSLS